MPTEVTNPTKEICSDCIPNPPIISLLFTEYTPLMVIIGMNRMMRKMMPKGLGTQL